MLLIKELCNQFALATAEVDDAGRAAFDHCVSYGFEPAGIEGDSLLPAGIRHNSILGIVRLQIRFLFVGLRLQELIDRTVRKCTLLIEIPLDDTLFRRMRRKPALAVAEQLIDLIGADPVVLLPVKYRDQHIKMVQQI